jgi:hypothetical protein
MLTIVLQLLALQRGQRPAIQPFFRQM